VDHTRSDSRHVPLEAHSLHIFKVAEIFCADTKLALATRSPAEHLSLLSKSDIVPSTTRDIDYDMIDKALNKLRLRAHTISNLFALFTIKVVLAPLVNSRLLSKAESVISTALDLCHG